MSHFTWIDWTVLVAYFSITMGIGVYFWRKSRSPEGFTAAERSLPGWLVGLSIFATFLSSISYLALPGKAYAENWNAFVFNLSLPVATWIAVVWFLPYYRQSRDVSAYSNLETRFGPWARLYASVFYLLTQLARVGVITYLLALPMSVIFGWNMATIIIVTGITVTIYTFIGGILAVIWTDAIQTLVLLAGAVVAVVALCVNLDGGLPAALSYAYSHGKLSLGDPGISVDTQGTVSLRLGQASILVVLLYALCDNLKNFGIDQSYVQRYQTAKNDAEARKSLWLGAIMYIPVAALFFLIGTLLFVFYTTGKNSEENLLEVRRIVAHQKLMQEGIKPVYVVDSSSGRSVFAPEYQRQVDARAVTMKDSDIGDRVFPHFIGKYLPPGLTGLLIAAIFSAGMSTISGSLNSSATLLLRDYYLRFFRPNASERESMRVLYCGTVLWGVLGTGVGLLLIRLTDTALDIWWTLVGIFGGGMLGLFLTGMMVRRARWVSALCAVITGTAVIFWLSLPDVIRWLKRHGLESAAETCTKWADSFGGLSPFHPYMIPFWGTLVMVSIGFLISFFEPRPSMKDENNPETDLGMV